MKNKILLLAGILLMAFSACNRSDKKVEALKHAIDVAEYQLKQSAAEFDTTQLFPRSWKADKFRAVDAYDWTSGFFPGSLWIGYQLTGDEALKSEAEKYTARLHEIPAYKGTHDLGFMVFCSYGMQQAIENDEVSAAAIVEASNSLSSRFCDSVGLIRSWDFGPWNYPVIIDNMMNLELLFEATRLSGDSTYYNIAVSHADQTLENHFREDGSSYHVVDYDPRTGEVLGRCTAQGYSDESAWARGQAWAIYGYTMAYRYTRRPEYLDRAEKVYEFVFTHLNLPADLVPYWDFDALNIPNEPRDASAAAIIASALYELNCFSDNKEYKNTADKILEALSSPAYRAETGRNHYFLLMHSVGSWPDHVEVDVPLNYADYYYLEALKRKRDVEMSGKLQEFPASY